MKIMIEVSGGNICGITTTEDCQIYLVDHDNLKERGGDILDAEESLHPDCITNEGGHIGHPGGDETPLFTKYLDKTLSPYKKKLNFS